MSHKINAKYKLKLKKIDDQLNALRDDNEDKEVALMEAFENHLSDTFLQDSVATTTEDYNYLEFLSQIVADYDQAQKKLEAQRAALFLVATHIAHRGRPLHANRAASQLKQLGADGKRTSMTMKQSVYCPPILHANPNLHQELYQRYGIKLLDVNYALAILTAAFHAGLDYNDKKLSALVKEFNLFNLSDFDNVNKSRTPITDYALDAMTSHVCNSYDYNETNARKIIKKIDVLRDKLYEHSQLQERPF